MRTDTTTKWLIPVSGTFFVAAGFYLFLGLVGSVLGPSAGIVARISAGSLADFLLEGLSWSAFFLPAYLWVAAIIVFLPGFRRDLLFVLLASLAPFAVVVCLARILDAALLEAAVSRSIPLGTILTVSLLGVLALALGLLVLALRLRIFGTDAPATSQAVPESKLEEVLFVESGSTDEEADGGRAGGFKLPPLPPALNLSSLDSPTRAAGMPTKDDGALEAATGLPRVEPGSLADEPDLLPEEYEQQPEEAELLPLDDEPIPVRFGRRSRHDKDRKDDGSDGSVSDPAMDADYWAESDGEKGRPTTSVAGSARGALLPRVEVFADGTHSEALREAESLPVAGAMKVPAANLPGLSRPSAQRLAKPLVPYTLPTEGILTAYPDGQYWIIDEKTRHAGEVLKETLKEFNIQAEVTGIRKGPVITMFEILPAPGVRLSKIATLSDNIALRLAASSVRIVAPIPGKHAVGIEVPNERRAIVSFREIVESEVFKSAKMEVPVVLGKDISGDVQVVELTQTPHLLIAGATGSGKSVCVNSIILSILYKRSFNEVKLILIDPKIVELKLYNGIPHL